MPFWSKRKPEFHRSSDEESRADRKPVLRCAGCGNVAPPYVYMSNGKDYCLDCARRIRDWMGAQPAGERAEDLKDLG